MSVIRFVLKAAAAFSLAVSSPAMAHHSAAMFDAKATQTVSGSVTAIEWTNPHVWLSVRASGVEAGKPSVWHFEMVGPAALARLGFNREMLSPGTAVTVEHHPLRDGRPGGQLLSVTFADGRKLAGVADRAAAPK